MAGSRDVSHAKPRWLLWWVAGAMVLLVGLGAGIGLVAWNSEPSGIDESALLPTTPGWTLEGSEPLVTQTFVLGADETAGPLTLSLLLAAVVILAGAVSGAIVLAARALHSRRARQSQ